MLQPGIARKHWLAMFALITWYFRLVVSMANLPSAEGRKLAPKALKVLKQLDILTTIHSSRHFFIFSTDYGDAVILHVLAVKEL